MNDQNRIVTAKATHYDESGRGVVKIGREEIGVFDLIPGETAQIKLIRRKDWVEAVVQKRFEESKMRTTPPCKAYYKCGSCNLQHMTYPEQLRFKHEYARKCFSSYGMKIEPEVIIGMDQPYRYRNKNQFGVALDPKRSILIGLYEESSHKIVPVVNCLIQDELTNRLFQSIRSIMVSMRIPAFEEDARRGVVRFILIKRGFKTNQTLLTIVTAIESFPGKNEFFKRVRSENPEINTLIHNVQSRKTSIVLGDKETVVLGKGSIDDDLLGLKFSISSKSFFQINPVQTEKLYQKVMEFLDLKGIERVVDAYSGIGTIGMVLASKAKEVFAVEWNKESHQNAIHNAKTNNIRNIRFFNEDAGVFLRNMAKEGEKIDVVVLDPPRSGSTPEFLNAIKTLSPKKVLYVSCEPSTQARDIVELLQSGYEIKRSCLVDMFPQTAHVETITLLSLKTA